MSTGKLFILIGPSGVGKSTVQAEIVKRLGLATAQGYFTRPMRPGEDGTDSYTITEAEFHRLDDAELLTAANYVHGYWYGTPKAHIREPISRGQSVVRIFTCDGAEAAKRDFPDIGIVTIFLEAPLGILRRRLRHRGDPPDARRRRLETAQEELPRMWEWDYLVPASRPINQVVDEVESIIRRELSWSQSQQSRHAA